MPDTTVKLSRSYTAHGKVFDQVVLREPTYRETHMEGLGKPKEWQATANGPMLVTYPMVVDEYLKRIATEPTYEHLSGLSAIDAGRLEKAVCDFFIEPTPVETMPTGSPSVSAGASASPE